jgi:ATP phosphoribosyltransferase
MRIALPKGRLLVGVQDLLREIGLTFQYASDRDYNPVCNDPGFRATLRKVRAIPQLVALGNFPVGFCGLDLVRESDYENVVPVVDLGLNPVKLVVAISGETPNILEDPPKRPLVIATEYEKIATQWAMERGLSHIIVQSWGSTESYAPEDADVVFDCVETGRTLRANGLVVVDQILGSSTWMIVNRSVLEESSEYHDRIHQMTTQLNMLVEGR